MRNSVIAFIFSETNFKKIILVQIGLAAIGCFYSHSFLFFILFLSHLTICIRFRGSFNGGSDMMTFVILIGTLISLSSSNPYYQKMGMLYISINTIYSYFKSGLSKIIQPEWRNGSALPAFLSRSLFTDIQSIAHWLQPRRCLGLLLCWFVLVFELSSALLIFFNDYTYFYLCFSILFHFLIFIGFGLNRFFWIWLSAWPATVFILW